MNFRTLSALCVLALTISAASGATFSNLGPITIPAEGTSGPAAPYPSTINVAGLGSITSITVDLFGFTHTFPDDVDILLVGPTGLSVILMSDVGGGFDVSGLNLTLDDSGAALPDNEVLTSGIFQPTNVGTGDIFQAPAPADPYGSLLASLIGSDPNGTWSLFVIDDVGADVGSFSGGWALNINDAPAAIPEPATTVLMAAGLALCALGLRRRKA